MKEGDDQPSIYKIVQRAVARCRGRRYLPNWKEVVAEVFAETHWFQVRRPGMSEDQVRNFAEKSADRITKKNGRAAKRERLLSRTKEKPVDEYDASSCFGRPEPLLPEDQVATREIAKLLHDSIRTVLQDESLPRGTDYESRKRRAEIYDAILREVASRCRDADIRGLVKSLDAHRFAAINAVLAEILEK